MGIRGGSSLFKKSPCAAWGAATPDPSKSNPKGQFPEFTGELTPKVAAESLTGTTCRRIDSCEFSSKDRGGSYPWDFEDSRGPRKRLRVRDSAPLNPKINACYSAKQPAETYVGFRGALCRKDVSTREGFTFFPGSRCMERR